MLTKLLNDFLEERQKQQNAEREEKSKALREAGKFKFYPSSIAKCRREIVYQMLGYPKQDIPTRVLRIFDNGDSMHERYQNWFAEMGILISPELPLKNEELCISGRTDALIRINDELVLVELKSANDRSFGWMVKKNEPKEDYVMQLQLYLHLTGIDKGIILIENKNDQTILEFPIAYDKEMSNELINKIKYCVDHAKSNEIPERDYTKSTFQCKYCDYAEMCWSSK